MCWRQLFCQSQAHLDGPIVKQVEGWVQLQHQPTWQRACPANLSVETVLETPVGVLPFLFLLPNVWAAALGDNALPAIAQASRVRSENRDHNLHWHLVGLTSHQEGEEGRAKLLQEFPVLILQVSRLDGRVAMLIEAATAPDTQPAQSLSCPPAPDIVRTPGSSARIGCAGASARTARPSCRGRRIRACYGSFLRRSTSHPQTPHIARRRYRRTEP